MVLFCVRGCLLWGANSVVVLTVLSFSLSDTSSSGGWSPLYGGGTSLDQEAIQYIHKFYCKDCRMEAERAEQEKAAAAASGSGGKGEGEPEYPPPTSPQSTLEEMSLQQSMDKNKESKHKYMYIHVYITLNVSIAYSFTHRMQVKHSYRMEALHTNIT